MERYERHYGMDELNEVVAALLPIVQSERIIAFSGELGAGKTTLIREICRQLQVVDNVSSPTFSIINVYHTTASQRIIHMDLYRLSSIAEAVDAGVEENLFSGDICLVEWPEKVIQIFPENYLFVQLRHAGMDQRLIRVFNQKNG